MNRRSGFPEISTLCLLLAGSGIAEESADWDRRIAETFSGRLKAIQSELAELPAKLEALPVIPIDDQGGTGGFASVHANAVPEKGDIFGVEILWENAAPVDMVALVPARRYDARGLDAHYGMPGTFTVDLLDAAGEVIRRIADETRTRSHPAREGHPFIFDLSPPVEAAGLRISASDLTSDTHEPNHLHAWAEVFALDGKKNLAQGAEVRRLGGSAPPAAWHWKPEFLIDGQTPLGLPEVPAKDHRNVGWLSSGRENPKESTTLSVDLGETTRIDGVRLLPVRRPTPDLPNGFGFPRKLRISAQESATDWRTVKEIDMPNPGHNPVWFSFPPVETRQVRIEAMELWKALESYPAFFALSEVEIFSGTENPAFGKPVRTSDGMLNLVGSGGSYWSSASLSDGYGSEGKLVSTREWLTLLDQRLQLETRRHELLEEADQLVKGWRNAALAFFVIFGLAATTTLIALPIRYRINSRRQLTQVRERIAGDLHDEVGSNLGSIQMYADLAEGRSGPSEELKRIQRIASETVSAVRDIVWLLRPGGNHRIGVVEHLRETSSIMLETLEWQFQANENAWQTELPEESNRHLFLFFREALHNLLRHSKATQAEVSVEAGTSFFKLTIRDNGIGISPEKRQRPSTLRALRQRSEALGATLEVTSNPGQGTQLELTIPRR